MHHVTSQACQDGWLNKNVVYQLDTFTGIQLCEHDMICTLQVLQCLASETALPSMAAKLLLPTVKAHEQQPDLGELPGRLREYAAQASSSSRPGHHNLPARVSLVKGAVICGRYDWSPDDSILETVRAAASFHGAEYFDSVVVASEVEGELWYAQLRALFSMTTADGVAHQLALVRWYEEVSGTSLSDQLASRFGCKRLRWAQQQRRGNQVPYHGVIPLSSIVRRQCIVPDCSARNCRISQRGAGASGEAQPRPYFYTNPFLWARI